MFREKGALYAAYIPLFTDGGLFVPTTRDYKLGEDIYLLLSLPDDPQRYPVAGKVGWITPANASGGRTQGVGVRFPERREDPAAEAAHRRNARHLDPVGQAHADDLSRRCRGSASGRAMYVDSHCHLTFEGLHERIDDVRAAMAAADVDRALVICTTLEEFDSVHALALRFDNFWASVGVHPDNEGVREPTVDDLLDARRTAARGGASAKPAWTTTAWASAAWPTWPGSANAFACTSAPRGAAAKPLVIHTRSASDDTLAILREEGGEAAGGVFHCFTETAEVARAALDLGFYISFSGILTFRNAAGPARRGRASCRWTAC